MKRQHFFSRGLRELGYSFLNTPAGRFVDRRLIGLASILAPEGILTFPSGKAPPAALPRPPGATADFNQKCTRCNDCVLACPHGTLFQFDKDRGPVLNPNAVACHLCEDWPCIDACETGALLPLAEGEVPAFGMATLHEDYCLNSAQKSTGNRQSDPCSLCESACPIADTVSFQDHLPVFAETCNGCGLCVAACPTQALEVVW